MEQKNILELLNQIKNNLYEQEISEAVIKIEKIYNSFPDIAKKDDFFTTKEMFKYLLDYFAKDTPDPQRESIYNDIRKKLITQTDYLTEYFKAYHQTDFFNIYSKFHQKIDYYSSLINIENDTLKLEDIFLRIWLTNTTDVRFSDTMKSFFENQNIGEPNKCVIVSAISLSLFRFFDFNKLNVLFDVYINQQNEAGIRALIGIVVTLLIHYKSAGLYTEIKQNLREIDVIEETNRNFEFIFLQLIKAKETEGIIKEFEVDILPKMKEMQDDIIKGFNDFDSFSSENMMDDENPGWENYFDKNPDFFEKVEKFTMRQFDGSDIFSATLGNLKNFDFFKKASNWFVPFYAENKEINDFLKGKIDDNLISEFLHNFEKASYFCNSDKYSFCLHIPDIAPVMRQTAIKMLVSEIDATQELLNEKYGNQKFQLNKSIITRYIQDLYRFYNFNKNFKGFDNIFKLNLGLHNNKIFDVIDNYSGILRSCAELSFSQKFFTDSIKLFTQTIDYGVNEADVYEKLAFANQKILNFDEALNNYLKAELFDHNKKWLFKKIGFCYLKTENYEEALKYYSKAEKEDAEDLGVLMFIGRCYISMKNYDTALKNYFKLDFFQPDNPKVMRSLAFCSLMLDKLEQTEKYLLRTIEIEPEKMDFLLLGNIFWIQKNKKEAISYYITAMNEFKTFTDFKKTFIENKDKLLQYGVSEFEITIMLDFLNSKYIRK